MSQYHNFGHSYLVCPALLELDPRHGEHWSKWPPCRKYPKPDPEHPERPGIACPRKHEHEQQLIDPEGHTAADFYWHPGARPPALDEPGNPMPSCVCGRWLVWVDLDNPFAPEHLQP